MSLWNVLASIRLTGSRTEKEYILLRVSTPPNGTSLVTDIRRCRGNRALRIGVSLHAAEVEWLYPLLRDRKPGTRESPTRKIIVSYEKDETTLVVRKLDGYEQKLVFNQDECAQLLEREEDLCRLLSSELNTNQDIEMKE